MILGRELFDNARLRIDIRGRQLEVLAADAVPRGVRVALSTVNGIEVFPIRVEGEEVLACLDIGNGSNVLIGSQYAERRGMSAMAARSRRRKAAVSAAKRSGGSSR